jgi:putative ABC transport system permease protein
MTHKMIVANMLHRPIRTVVSVLAVAIEVALVLLVVGLTTGMLRAGAERVHGVGADIMVQPPGASLFLGLTTAPMPVKEEDLLRALPHVQAVTPVLVQFNTSNGLNLVYGIDMRSWNEVSGGFVYYSGGPLTQPLDILVDNYYAQDHHVKVGQTLGLLGHDFHVVGVVEHGKGARLYTPLATLQELQGAVNHASIFYIKCAKSQDTPSVLAAIKKLLPNNKVLSVDQYMSMLTSSDLPALRDFVNVMIFIAVAIGFLVIFLSMYTTITERTREIGILKSLGASKVYVVHLILQEAAALSFAGIALGFVAAWVVQRLTVAFYPTVPVHLTAEWFVWAALLAVLGAVVGSFYPALRAASLDPIDALAYE